MSRAADDSSVLLIGGHDTGKSIYIGRLWLALRRGNGLLAMPEDPNEIEYVEGLIRDLEQGHYPGRTDNDGEPRDFEGTVLIRGGERRGATAHIVVPDAAGELWERASEERELENRWIGRIHACTGALLFLRFGSKHHVEGLDWVTSAEKMKLPLAQALQKEGIATQVVLTDMLNMLELHLGKDPHVSRPRVSIVVAAWDALPPETRAAGPRAYIDTQYPMFGGRLRDYGRLTTRVFATSITGGDLNTAAHRSAFLKSNADEEGYVVYQQDNDEQLRSSDLTLPVAWALGVDLT